MNSASATASNASSLKSGASRHHPVRSPPDRHSPAVASKAKSPPSDVVKKESKPLSNGLNGDLSSNTANGQDDSEAETIHLSDEGSDKARAKKRAMKSARNDDADISSPPLTSKSEPTLSNVSSRDSSLNRDRHDRESARSNGHGGKENGIRSTSAKAIISHKARFMKDADPKARAHSAEAATPPATGANNRAKSVEPRKRKLSDARPSKLEPPRQRPRLDDPIKASSPISRTVDSVSPPASASSTAKSHKRSTSTQSSLPNALPRSRRAPPSEMDTSSESSSPRAKRPPLLAPPSSKTSGRALTSPARMPVPHGKKTDKYGQTALARACEKGNLDAVKTAYEQAPDELDYADNSGVAPLQNAALKGYADIVEFLLAQGCRKDCRSGNMDTPLIDAVENGHIDVVKILLSHGVNPHHQNERGQRAIDLIDPDDDYAVEMENLLQQAMRDYEGPATDDEATQDEPQSLPLRRGERKDLLHKDTTTSSLREYAQRGDLEAVDYFLNMRVKPDNECTVVAARGGHAFVLNLLLADISDKDPDPATHEETPMLAAIGRGHLKVIQTLLDLPEFNPCRKTREGKTYWEIAEERRGPRWQSERDLLKERYDQYRTSHGSKLGKKKRSQETAAHARLSSGSKSELSSPKLINRAKVKTERLEIEKSDEPQRQKRYLLAKEHSIKEKKVRRRRVVDDESSYESSYDDATDNRPPSKQERRRKNSTAGKGPRFEKEKEKEQPSPRLRYEKIDKEKRPVRKATLSESPKSDRHKKPEGSMEKPPIKEGTPESVREARRAAEKVEAERKRREKEEFEAKKAEEERLRKEEEERKAEEERLRREEEIHIAEMKRKEEEARKAEEARRRKERLESLPIALRYALELGPNRPLRFMPGPDRKTHVVGIQYNFLPILYWPLEQIDPSCDEAKRGEKWIMSFYVVGLLGLGELYLKEFPDWEKRPVPQEEKAYFLRGYFIDRLAQYYAFPDNAPNVIEANRDLRESFEIIDRTKEQFLKMEPLFYVKLDDFLKKTKEYKHLEGLSEELKDVIPGPMLRKPTKWCDELDCATCKNSPERVSLSAGLENVKREDSIAFANNTNGDVAGQGTTMQLDSSGQDSSQMMVEKLAETLAMEIPLHTTDTAMNEAPPAARDTSNGQQEAQKDVLKTDPDRMDEG